MNTGGPQSFRATILVVDDDHRIRRLIRYCLEDLGYQVTEAKDGYYAVEVARSKRLDLILMDINMLTVNGLAATKLIRHIKGCENVPIVAVTGGQAPEFREEAGVAGFSGYISKPINFTTLVSLIDSLLPKEQG